VNVIKELAKWATEDPKRAVALVAVLLGGSRGVSRMVSNIGRFAKARQEKYNKERYTYDHSLDIYLKTKRKLTKRDLMNIERLRGKGYTKAQAMLKLNLLED
jgi:ABC-type nitrate/sulfonate/bicarbonate transport system substrate-binding protein